MAKWKYRSLEWIHKIREKNFEETKSKPLEKIINQSIMRAKKREKDYVS